MNALIRRWVVLATVLGAVSLALSGQRAPLVFEANRGQIDASAAFVARGDGFEALVDATGVLVRPEGVRLRFLDANLATGLLGVDELPGKVNYLAGSDRSRWLSNLPTYAGVMRTELYPGVSLTYRGERAQLAIELALAPGADPRSIRLGVEGIDTLRVDAASGDLILDTGGSGTRLRMTGGASFVIRGENEVGLLIPPYDHDQPLAVTIRIERPAASRSPSPDDVVRVATDRAGNAYVAGRTATMKGETAEAFVTKLARDGRTRLYTTYFGGEGEDSPLAIAVNPAGEVVVAGRTTSGPALRGASDAFVAKIAASGSAFIFSTYLGGDADDEARAIDIDGDGSVWIAGKTTGAGFPKSGDSDAFVAHLTEDGSRVISSTSFGGGVDDAANVIRVDAKGYVYVAGATGSGDGFVARLDARGTKLAFPTELKANGGKAVTGLGIDDAGFLHVAGRTGQAGGRFVATLSADGSELPHFVRLAATGAINDDGFAVGSAGDAWVATGDGAYASRIAADGRVLERIPRSVSRGDTVVTDLALAPDGHAIIVGVSDDANAAGLLPLESASSGGQIFASGGTDAPAAGCPGSIHFTNTAGTGLWQTAANWDLNRVPLVTDDVCIPAGFAVTLSAVSQTVNSLFADSTSSLTITAGLSVATTSQVNGSFAMQSGTLTGAGDFIVVGSFTWTGGTLTGAGNVFANGGMTLSGAGTRDITASRLLTTAGVVTWTGAGVVRLGTGGAITNNGGTWDCQSDATIATIGTPGPFTNPSGAIFQKSAGTGTTTIGVPFNNGGSLNVKTGTINLSGGGNSPGGFTGLAGTTLQFGGGTYNLQPLSVVGAATVVFSAGTINVDGGYIATAGTTVSGATVNFDPAGSVGNVGTLLTISGGIVNFSSGEAINTTTLNFTAGTLQGTDTVTVSGVTTWTSGTMTGAGTTSANGGMVASGASTRDVTGSRLLTVSGPTTWTGTGIFRFGTGGAITNNGTWDCQSDSQISTIGTPGPFTNALGATFKKSAGSGVTSIGVAFNNLGTASVLSGTLNLSAGGTDSGSFTGAAGTTLQFGGGTHSLGTGSSIAADTVAFSAGTTNIDGDYTAAAGTTVNGGIANFDPAGTVLGVGPSIVISSGTANFSSGEAINTTTLNFTAGTLQGTDAATVSGVTTWTSGTMTGAGTTSANGGMVASGAGTRDVTGSRLLTVSGPTTWTGTGIFRFGTGGAITNNGTWDCQSDAQITTIGTPGPFTNALGATFKKSAGSGVTAIGVAFNNLGTASVLSGTLNLNAGGTGSSAFTGSAGTTLQFGAGTYALTTTSSVNADTVLLNGGTINVGGVYTVNATTISNSIVNFDSPGPSTTTTLALSSGTIQGTGTLTISGLMTWTGGTMTAAGTTNANGGIALTGGGTRDVTASRVLNTTGTTTWTGSGNLRLGSLGTINNNGVWDCQSDALITTIGAAGPFTNALGATFKKSAGTGTTTVGVAFNNTGTMSVLTGTLNLSGGGTSSAAFNGSAGATVQFGGGTYTLAAASSVNADAVLFSVGTVSVGGVYNVNATTIAGAVVVGFDVAGPSTTTTLAMSSGTIQGTGTLTISGLTTWTGGTMTASGTTNANGGIAFTGTGSRDVTASHVLNTAGTTTWTGTGNVRLGTGATINNSGLWDCQSDASIVSIGTPPGPFTNALAGTFKKSGGSTTTAVGVPFNNAGSVQALAAALQFTGGYTQTAGATTLNGGTISSSTTMNIQGGSYNGVGTTTANVTSSGHAVPGLPIGTLTVAGNYTQSSSGALDIDIGGHTAGTEYDQLNLTGTGVATFAGAFNVSLANGFIPVGGDSFTIMNFTSSTGTFGTINTPPLAAGCWRTFYNPTALVVQVWTNAPEVAAVALAPDKSTVTWAPLPAQSGPSATYDLMRGRTSELPVGNKPSETCLISGTTSTSFSDATTPAAGTGFYYLVRGTNACGQGTYGTTTSGAPRTSTVCP